MKTLDFKYPELGWRRNSRERVRLHHADVFADVRSDGFAPVCERPGGDGRAYLVAVRGGFFWLVRYAEKGPYSLEAVRLRIPYHDDCEVVEPAL